MTFNLQQPFTQGYGSIVGKNPFETLGDVPSVWNAAHTRFAGDALGHIASNAKQKLLFKAQKELMQPQQSQGFGLSQGLDLATDLFGAFSGGFGGGGFSYGDTPIGAGGGSVGGIGTLGPNYGFPSP